MAFITTMMPSSDTNAWNMFLDAVDTIQPGFEPSRCRHPGDVMLLCVMALAKWPCVVAAALSEGVRSSLDHRSASASEWRQYIMQLVVLADCKRGWADVANTTAGRGQATLGLVWFCKRMRILQKVPSDLEPRANAKVYKLGRRQHEYEELPEQCGVTELDSMLQAIRSVSVVLPAPSGGDVAAWSHAGSRNVFVAQVKFLADQICGVGSQFAAGALARRFLGLVERSCGDEAWDACQMELLNSALPDMNSHTSCLGHMRVVDVRRRFGMSPLIISGLACLWGKVPHKHRKQVLHASYTSIFRAVESFEDRCVQPCEWAASVQ